MSGNVLLDTVVPALGALVSTAMYLSPLKAVMKASREKNLGELNPLPLSVTVANCIAWMVYGLLKHDPFVTAPNAAGVLIAVFMTLTAHGLADEAARHKMRFVCCLTAGAMPLLGVFTAFGTKDLAAQQGAWGLAGNVISLVYYAAPLSTMWDVIRTRNSASILVPLTLMNTLNAALWTTYGLAVRDVYIWLPNGIGLALSVLQVALRVVFPARAAATLPSHQHHAPSPCPPRWPSPVPSDADSDVNPLLQHAGLSSSSGGSGGAKYSRLDEGVGLTTGQR